MPYPEIRLKVIRPVVVEDELKRFSLARARIIAEELKRQGLTETELLARRKSDPAKLALAGRLRRETTLTMGWIAKRLQMGTRKSAAMKLRRWGKEQGESNPRQTPTMV